MCASFKMDFVVERAIGIGLPVFYARKRSFRKTARFNTANVKLAQHVYIYMYKHNVMTYTQANFILFLFHNFTYTLSDNQTPSCDE